MLAGIRITDHIRLWRLRRHLGQVALGAQVGLGASTISASKHGDGDMRIRRKKPRRTPMELSVSWVCTKPAEARPPM
jgi:hypothetical protein